MKQKMIFTFLVVMTLSQSVFSDERHGHDVQYKGSQQVAVPVTPDNREDVGGAESVTAATEKRTGPRELSSS